MNFPDFRNVVTTACVAALLPLSAHAADITGAGATFPAPIYGKWAEAYQKATGNKINYQSIGSGGGIKQIVAKTVDFGASDMPLKQEELDKQGLMQFPAVIGGEVLVYNLPGIKSGEIRLTGAVLADIFLGKIVKWNDKALADLNPKVSLPDQAMVPAPPSSSPTTCPRSARNGRPKSAKVQRCNGRWDSAARVTRASRLSSSAFPVRSATSNMPTPSRAR